MSRTSERRSGRPRPSAIDTYQALIERVPDIIIEADRSGIVRYVNRSELVDPQGALGQRIHDFVPPTELERFQSTWDRALATGQESSYEVSIYEAGGHRHWHNRLIPVSGDDGIERIVFISSDISEVVRARAELEASSSRLHSFVKYSSSPTAMFDRDLRYIAASDSWLDFFGLAADDIVDTLDLEVMASVTSDWTRHLHQALDGSWVRLERCESPDGRGSTRYVDWQFRPWHDSAGTIRGVVVSATDVTAQVDAELKLRKAADDLARVNMELEQFVYVASHDLRAPLRAIQNLADWVTEDCGDMLPEASRKNLTVIKQRAARMQQMLRDLLDFALKNDAELGNSLDFDGCLRRAVEMSGLPSTFVVTCRGEAPTLRGSSAALEQVLRNLMTNAAKHHDRERGTIDVSVASRGDGYATIIVADDGPGIASEYRGRVFRMFATLKPSHDQSSTGIGLALVQKLVAQVGGDIHIEDNVPRGCRFVLTWPTLQGGARPSLE